MMHTSLVALALLGLCLVATARPGPADTEQDGVDPRKLLARDLVGQQRNLLQTDDRGRVKWKLTDCTISKSNEVTCDSKQANACCDGTGCTSWANNDVVTCEAQRFIGCCGSATTRSPVEWELSSCTITKKKVGTCPSTAAQACSDGTGCSSWANADSVSCSSANLFGCCGKK